MRKYRNLLITFARLAFLVITLAIAIFFVSIYYNLSLEISLMIFIGLLILIIFSIFLFVKPETLNETEKLIFLTICCSAVILILVAFSDSYGSGDNYVQVKQSDVGDYTYITTNVIEPYLSIVKAIESYVDSELSSDAEKAYMKNNIFYSNKYIKASDNGYTLYYDTMTYPLYRLGGVICLNDINSKLCKLWLDKLVDEIKDKVKDNNDQSLREYLKNEKETKYNNKKIEEVKKFYQDNNLKSKE